MRDFIGNALMFYLLASAPGALYAIVGRVKGYWSDPWHFDQSWRDWLIGLLPYSWAACLLVYVEYYV